MSNKDLHRQPKKVSMMWISDGKFRPTELAWFYEESGGLTIVAEESGQYKISWSQVRAALRRKDKK